MSNAELTDLIQKNDKAARKAVFEKHYSNLAGIAARYSKNQTQADEMLQVAFNNVLNRVVMHKQPQTIDLETFIPKEFIIECIAFIKNNRSEYYVSSTVYATETVSKNYDLFEDNEVINYKNIDNELLVRSLQQMVPSQRLVFNLHVVDGYPLHESALMLESSEETVKSNLEKSRFNLQKNIEKSLKSIKP